MVSRKARSPLPVCLLLDLVNAPGCPAEHRRIYIAKIPFVGGNLSVGMLVPFAHDEIELALGEMRIDQGERNAVESEVPRRVPGIFPFVRHRHDALVVKVTPLGVAAGLSLVRRWWVAGIAVQPLLDDVMIELLAPKHAGEGLALDRVVFVRSSMPAQARVKFVRFRLPAREALRRNRRRRHRIFGVLGIVWQSQSNRVAFRPAGC